MDGWFQETFGDCEIIGMHKFHRKRYIYYLRQVGYDLRFSRHLSVNLSLLATSCKNCLSGLHETFTRDVSVDHRCKKTFKYV